MYTADNHLQQAPHIYIVKNRHTIEGLSQKKCTVPKSDIPEILYNKNRAARLITSEPGHTEP